MCLCAPEGAAPVPPLEIPLATPLATKRDVSKASAASFAARLVAQQAGMREAVLAKAARLESVGWKEYK